MMYYYWKTSRIFPSVFYNMKAGERIIVRAFYEKEIEERQKITKNENVMPVRIV